MKKKGVLEVQFNWIFIMIAGAIILMFFVSIVTKHKSLSDDRLSSSILVDLETILTGAKVSTGTINIISIPNKEITFECNKYQLGRLNIGIKDKVLFSPDVIKGRKLITLALDWNLPFRVTNFLYLTHPEVRYIIVGDDALSQNILYEWLPEEVNPEQADEGNVIEDKNNYRVKFVFVEREFMPADDGMLDNLAGMQDEHVKAINIKSSTGNSGKIDFYEKQGNGWRYEGTSHYLKKESLLGAIFAHELKTYNCAMERAFKKLEIISTIYEGRTLNLYQDGSAGLCTAPYMSAQESLVKIKNYASEFNGPNIGGIVGETEIIKHQNGIVQLNSCVLIY